MTTERIDALTRKFTDRQLTEFLGYRVHPEEERAGKDGQVFLRQQDGSWMMEDPVITAARHATYMPPPTPWKGLQEWPEAHYNGLTNAKMERLDILAEELAECLVNIGKIKRHGSVTVDHVADPPKAYWNTMALEQELGQVLGVMNAMAVRGDLDLSRVRASQATAWSRKLPYTHHQYEDDPALFSATEPLEP